MERAPEHRSLLQVGLKKQAVPRALDGSRDVT